MAVGRRHSNPLRAVARLLLLIPWTVVLYVAFLIRRLGLRRREDLLRVAPAWAGLWARGTARLMGVRIAHEPLPPRGVLLCPNHLGYADVLALAATLPCFFVSRADAASWPLIGRLIRASEQVLVSRRRHRDLKTNTSSLIAERLRCGQSVSVFLEGTSTGGDRLLPFLPALLQPAIDTGADIVPVGLRWEAEAAGMTVADDVAYWGDHRFPTHFSRLLGLPGCRVTIRFGSPISTRGRDRKELAREVRRQVQRLVFARIDPKRTRRAGRSESGGKPPHAV